ncbi:MAG: hypothetical protein AAGC95_18455 [Pseudomonadota bacterium]
MAWGRFFRKTWDDRTEVLRAAAAPVLGGAAVAACVTLTDGERTRFAPKAPEAPEAPALSEADLLGLGAADVEALIGAPALVRREGEGEMRRYVFSECSLLVFLYPAGEGPDKVVYLDAAARASGADKPTVDACLADSKARV